MTYERLYRFRFISEELYFSDFLNTCALNAKVDVECYCDT